MPNIITQSVIKAKNQNSKKKGAPDKPCGEGAPYFNLPSPHIGNCRHYLFKKFSYFLYKFSYFSDKFSYSLNRIY